MDPVSLTGVGSSLASEAAAVAGSLSDGNYKQQDLRRTPSTSAIYETLRRSKELRESLSSRPSSRLSIDNNMLTSSGYRDAVSQHNTTRIKQVILIKDTTAKSKALHRRRVTHPNHVVTPSLVNHCGQAGTP